MRKLLVEALAVGLLGAAVAFAANGLRRGGVELRRDYFPPPSKGTNTSRELPQPAGTNALSAEWNLLEELRSRDLQLADSNLVAQLYHDPRYQQGIVVFIDARDQKDYEAGHIPGAYGFNYYEPAPYLPTVLPLCQVAQQIVFYCNGGHCDDSILAACFLRQMAEIPNEKLFVYGGGFAEWSSTNRLPVEIGQRLSGQIRNTP